MGKIIAEITVLPVGTSTPSLSDYIAEVEKVLQKYPAVRSELTPMSTILEGEWDDVMAAIKEMHQKPFQLGVKRVATRISIDERHDKAFSKESKIQAVKEKLALK